MLNVFFFFIISIGWQTIMQSGLLLTYYWSELVRVGCLGRFYLSNYPKEERTYLVFVFFSAGSTWSRNDEIYTARYTMTLMHDRESDPRNCCALWVRLEHRCSARVRQYKSVQHSEDREEPFETHANELCSTSKDNNLRRNNVPSLVNDRQGATDNDSNDFKTVPPPVIVETP